MPHEPHIPGLRRVMRNPDGRIERDVDEEISFHIESRIDALIQSGLSKEAARRTAEAEFGDVHASRRELAAVDRHRRRRERAVRWLLTSAHDLRQAVRSLRRSPAFAIAATLTLVIGMGASVAIFAVVNGVLLRPLPFGESERLVRSRHDLPGINMTRREQAASMYFTYLRLAQTIQGIGVYTEGDVNVAEPGGAGEPARVTSANVSATLIPVLKVSPILGHVFTEEEDRPGAPPVVLIGEGMWRSRFGADPKIIGRTLEVDGMSHEIVGVMPTLFRFPTATTQLWIPLQLDPVNPPQYAYTFSSIARLKPGVTIAAAERDFATVLPRVADLYPDFVSGITTAQMLEQFQPKPLLVPLQADITGGIAGTLWTVAAAAGLLLLVASANVANLTLVRADARQRELAVRQALGAGRARIVWYFFAESAVVAGVAATLGLVAATVAVRALVAAGPVAIPRLAEVKIDASSVLFTLASAVFVALACSAIPAIRIGRGRLALREGGRSGTAGRQQHRVRGALVAGQIALTLVVLAGSGLLMRTFQRLNAVRPGFDPKQVSTFWISLPAARYVGDTAVAQFYSQLVERVAALPGVSVVGITSRLPLQSHGINQNPIYPEDDLSFANKLPPLHLVTVVNEEYFRAMSIPMVAGRTFDGMERQREGDAIISRATAQFFWKDSTGVAALGKRFRPLPTSPWYTVIGVVGDTRDTALTAPPSHVVYLPETLEGGRQFKQSRRTVALVVRTAGERTEITPAVMRAVQELDSTLPIFDVRPMTAVMSAAMAKMTFVIILLGSAAVVTLVLGAVGLYGVLTYVVTLRTRELAIRMALGATPRALAAAMTRYGVALTAVGIAIGLVIFTLVARFLRSLLFGVATSDPVTLGGSALILVVIAMMASWLPARRAAQVDPADALRAE